MRIFHITKSVSKIDNIFVHPKPFSLIFSLELWEQFGFYGMQALLVLFLVRRLGMSDALADNTFSAFFALVYAFVVVGGCIGDKLLGTKRTMVIGAFILAVSYFLLGLYPERYLYWALGGIVAGNALFKANPSSLVSKLYKKGAHARIALTIPCRLPTACYIMRPFCVTQAYTQSSQSESGREEQLRITCSTFGRRSIVLRRKQWIL